MIKHTEGKWFVEEGNTRHFIKTIDPRDDKTIVIAMIDADQAGYDKSIANGKLIATAPDLLKGSQKALIKILKITELIPEEGIIEDAGAVIAQIKTICDAMWKDLQPAIQKATT